MKINHYIQTFDICSDVELLFGFSGLWELFTGTHYREPARRTKDDGGTAESVQVKKSNSGHSFSPFMTSGQRGALISYYIILYIIRVVAIHL